MRQNATHSGDRRKRVFFAWPIDTNSIEWRIAHPLCCDVLLAKWSPLTPPLRNGVGCAGSPQTLVLSIRREMLRRGSRGRTWHAPACAPPAGTHAPRHPRRGRNGAARRAAPARALGEGGVRFSLACPTPPRPPAAARPAAAHAPECGAHQLARLLPTRGRRALSAPASSAPRQRPTRTPSLVMTPSARCRRPSAAREMRRGAPASASYARRWLAAGRFGTHCRVCSRMAGADGIAAPAPAPPRPARRQAARASLRAVRAHGRTAPLAAAPDAYIRAP